MRRKRIKFIPRIPHSKHLAVRILKTKALSRVLNAAFGQNEPTILHLLT